jgi:membrane-associated protein
MTVTSLQFFLPNLLLFIDPESLIKYGGLLLVYLMIFGSTGLFFCFFFPSGAVLFTAGVLTATGVLLNDIFTVCLLLILASVSGSITGYGFGWKAGDFLYRRSDSKFFRRKHLIAAEEFYKKYGALALTAGFFLPIIRTFAPIVAGMIRLRFRRYVMLTVAGSVVWVLSFVLAGYFLGSRPFLKPWLKYIVIGFILVVTIPLVIRIIKELRKPRKETEDKT